MKREDLTKLGLTDETVIDAIMAAHGKDLEKFKTTAETASAENATLKNQLTDASNAIESFKAMDIDGVKKSASEWKTKAEQAALDAQKQIDSMRFDHALDSSLNGAKAKNPKAVKALLDINGLKFNESDGSIVGLDEQLKKVKEANDYLFESDTPTPRIVTPGNPQPLTTDSVVLAARKAAGLPVK